MKQIQYIFPLLLFLVVISLPNTSLFGQDNNSHELEKINHKIESLRTKRDHVKSDPVEHEKALNSGWYDTIEMSLKKLFDQKRSIIKEQTGKTFVSLEEFEAMPSDKKNKLLEDDKYQVEKEN